VLDTGHEDIKELYEYIPAFKGEVLGASVTLHELAQARLNALRVRIHFLDQQGTEEAAVELGAALSAAHALQGLVVVPLEPAIPSRQIEPIMERDEAAISKKFAPASQAATIELPSRQRKHYFPPPRWTAMQSSLAVLPRTKTNSAVAHNDRYPVRRDSPMPIRAKLPYTHPGSSTLQDSKAKEFRRDSLKEQGIDPTASPFPNSGTRQPPRVHSAEPNHDISNVDRESARSELGHSDEGSPGPVFWTEFNRRHGHWSRARWAAKKAEMQTQDWCAVPANENDDNESQQGGNSEIGDAAGPRDEVSSDEGWVRIEDSASS